MAIPDYQSLMLPFLRCAANRNEISTRELVDALANEFQLTADERAQLIPSGVQTLFYNRVGWAQTYLRKAGLTESPRHGVQRITPRGRAALAENPARIDIEFLKRFPDFVAFRDRRTEEGTGTAELVSAAAARGDEATPEEALEIAYRGLRSALETEILDQVKKSSPAFFERLVVELLVRMGYGGSRQDAGAAVGKSGDGGIDGIIKQDALGLDAVYLQAKCWKRTIGRPEIQAFAGALQGRHARKGVFITTSSYSSEARDYVSRIDSKIVLIDGAELAKLMIDHGVGVSTARTYELKRIDSDFFEEG